MERPYKATLGSISHGTLRAIDLLGAFADELDRLEPDHDLTIEARAVLTLARAGWVDIVDSEEASELVTTLSDALNEHAPAYCYFGASEGDGSDFGFWPDMLSIDELPRIQDPNEADDYDECCFVSDHGNVSVYVGGSIAIDFV
jgi:hypothetical protein